MLTPSLRFHIRLPARSSPLGIYVLNGANAGAAGQRWYTTQGTFTPGSRTIAVKIYETTGGKFDTATPPGQGTAQVGTGTMTFQSCSAATFSYNFTGGSSIGRSGSITRAASDRCRRAALNNASVDGCGLRSGTIARDSERVHQRNVNGRSGLLHCQSFHPLRYDKPPQSIRRE